MTSAVFTFSSMRGRWHVYKAAVGQPRAGILALSRAVHHATGATFEATAELACAFITRNWRREGDLLLLGCNGHGAKHRPDPEVNHHFLVCYQFGSPDVANNATRLDWRHDVHPNPIGDRPFEEWLGLSEAE